MRPMNFLSIPCPNQIVKKVKPFIRLEEVIEQSLGMTGHGFSV